MEIETEDGGNDKKTGRQDDEKDETNRARREERKEMAQERGL